MPVAVVRNGMMAVLSLALVGCSKIANTPNEGTEAAAVVAPPQADIPSEIGVFAMIDGQWSRMQLADYESLFGGYMGTEGTIADNYPRIVNGSAFILNKVPLDPSQVVWGINLAPRSSMEARGRLDVSSENEQPASVSEVRPGVYRVEVKDLPSGLHALILKAGRFSSRAVIFNIP